MFYQNKKEKRQSIYIDHLTAIGKENNWSVSILRRQIDRLANQMNVSCMSLAVTGETK